MDHVRTVLSAEELPMSAPSFENLTLEMARLWAVRVLLRMYGLKDSVRSDAI